MPLILEWSDQATALGAMLLSWQERKMDHSISALTSEG